MMISIAKIDINLMLCNPGEHTDLKDLITKKSLMLKITIYPKKAAVLIE